MGCGDGLAAKKDTLSVFFSCAVTGVWCISFVVVKSQLLLRVSTEYFVAGSIWQKIGGIWSCLKAAPILRWMVGMNRDRAKLALLKMDAQYEWIRPRLSGPSNGLDSDQSRGRLCKEPRRHPFGALGNPSESSRIAQPALPAQGEAPLQTRPEAS